MDSKERLQITRLSTVPADSILHRGQLTALNEYSFNAYVKEDEMVHRTRCTSKVTLVIAILVISMCGAIAVAVIIALL